MGSSLSLSLAVSLYNSPGEYAVQHFSAEYKKPGAKKAVGFMERIASERKGGLKECGALRLCVCSVTQAAAAAAAEANRRSSKRERRSGGGGGGGGVRESPAAAPSRIRITMSGAATAATAATKQPKAADVHPGLPVDARVLGLSVGVYWPPEKVRARDVGRLCSVAPSVCVCAETFRRHRASV